MLLCLSANVKLVRVQISALFQWLSARKQCTLATALAWDANSSKFNRARVVALTTAAKANSAKPPRNIVHKNFLLCSNDITAPPRHRLRRSGLKFCSGSERVA